MKFIKRILCRLFPRYKLHCILKVLKLAARPWQVDFALGRSNAMPEGRATGKTAAVMLRALMADPKKVKDLEKVIAGDCDYLPVGPRKFYYIGEYIKYSGVCIYSGIPVPELTDDGKRRGRWEVRR